MLKSISFDDFSRETFADIFLVGCLFMQTKCANRWDYKRGFISDLRSSIKFSYYVFFGYFFLTLCLIRSKSPNRSYTSYGLCLTFNGELEDQSKLVAFGRKAQLSFVGIYSKNN